MPLVLVLFFCSGACGLAYQVLWVRQLSFIFGVTAYAAGTVLAAFMAGLALGSWLAGPLLARITRPLAAFGIAELLIGASAVTTPIAFGVASSVYRTLYLVSDSFLLQTLARFACAFAVLLVPTVLMGLTLPLLSASPLVRGSLFSSRVGALYAVNTAGAVTGALLTGFVLIGSLGVARTFMLAAVGNAMVGIAAIALDRWKRQAAARDPRTTSATTSAPHGHAAVWWVMAASGFASLALEVVWFRLMTQALDATTYAFTLTLAGVLVGIALGGAASSRLLRFDADWLAWLALVQVGTAIATLVGVGILTWERPLGLDPMRAPTRVVLLVLLPSLLMGISFPLLLKLGVPAPASAAADDSLRGKLVGRFYGVNVLGAIAGSIVGGFLIVPAFGTWAAIVILAGVFLAAGALLAATHPNRPRLLAMVGAGTAVFVWTTTTLPDPFTAAMRRRAPAGALEVFRHDGVQTAVTVHETTFQRTLNVGGLHQANDSPAMVRLHRSIGILPMALHPRPASALVIGLGGGATAGAVSQHTGTSVQIVELSESVRRAAPFFSHVTYDVLNRSNVRVRVDDGRNFLALSGETFDVITADIIQPVHAGAGHLYSREYFELVRSALNPGGLALQWIGHRETAHYKLIMRTFLDVFPDATLWLNGELMVGSLTPLRLDEAAFTAKLADPQTRTAMHDAGLDSFDTLRGWYTGGPREMRAFVGVGPVLTDDRPLVEYHRSLAADTEALDVSRLKGSVEELQSVAR